MGAEVSRRNALKFLAAAPVAAVLSARADPEPVTAPMLAEAEDRNREAALANYGRRLYEYGALSLQAYQEHYLHLVDRCDRG